MDHIKDVLSQVVGKMSRRELDYPSKIDRIWQNILEPQELKHASLVGTRDGVLLVLVDSPVWLYQMRAGKNKILEKLKDEGLDIKEIRFQIGKVK